MSQDQGVQRWLVADLRADAGTAPRAIQLKLDKLARDPFCFFRGTLPEYVRRVGSTCRGPLYAPVGVITGDLHLENLGTYGTRSGEVAFDLNDFDDAGWAPLAIDLRRLAASARLAAARQPGGNPGRGAEAVLDGFERGLTSPPPSEPEVVRGLRAQCRRLDVASFVKGSLESGPAARLPASEPQVVALLEGAVRDLRQRTPPALRLPARFYRVLDAAPRLAGNGSLGRRRYLALLAGADPAQGAHALLDFKEARHSPWGRAGSLCGERLRARQVEVVARSFRAESERVLGTARLHGRLFQVREHSAFGLKVAANQLEPAAQQAYAAHCGRLIAQAWGRAQQPVEELARALGGGGRAQLLAEVASDADRILADHAEFLAQREAIAHALGLRGR